MKARVKATEEIIEVIPYSGFDDYDYYDPETKLPWFKRELSFDVTNSDPDYWEKLKHQAAINIYCAYVENNGCEWSLDQAIKEATALVEKLKGE